MNPTVSSLEHGELSVGVGVFLCASNPRSNLDRAIRPSNSPGSEINDDRNQKLAGLNPMADIAVTACEQPLGSGNRIMAKANMLEIVHGPQCDRMDLPPSKKTYCVDVVMY